MDLSSQVKQEECSPTLAWGLYTISQRTPSPELGTPSLESRTPSPRFGHASRDALCMAKLPGQSFVFPAYHYNEIRPAKSPRRKAKTELTPNQGDPASSASNLAPFCSSALLEAPLHVASSPKPISRPHIPRPPNAFMIFRSHFLKLDAADCLDRRQQNLSRLAGTAWNSLTSDEKAKWHEEAAQALLKHQQEYPNYKFTPAPRGSRRAKNTIRVKCEDSEKGEYRDVRDKYMGIPGVSETHRRQRNVKREHRVEFSTRIAPHQLTGHSSQAQFSPALPCSASDDSPALPPCFPQVSYPHIIVPRRPSTSLGFSSSTSIRDKFYRGTHHKRSLTRPSSAASSNNALSGALYDLDIASASSGLETVSLPSTPLSSPVGQFSNPWTTFNFANQGVYRRQPDVSVGPTDIEEPFMATPSPFQQINHQSIVNDAFLDYYPSHEEQCKLHIPMDNAGLSAYNPPSNFEPSQWTFTNGLGDGSNFLCSMPVGTYTP